MTLKPAKCKFAHTQVNYLGHIISAKGIEPDPAKIDAVKNFPVPKDAKSLQRFLGLASYYRRFVYNFSMKAAPLFNLLHKDTKFIWSKTQQKAFEELKNNLVSTPILAFPNFNKPFKVITDASNTGIGAVLAQDNEEHENVIAYASRILSPAERNYATIERECLAIVWGIAQFRPYLYGQQFTVVTDHNPLTYLQNTKNASQRLTRWALKLQEYDFIIKYKPGRKNKNADALSRIFEPNATLNSLLLTSGNTQKDETTEFVISIDRITLNDFQEAQQRDPDTIRLMARIGNSFGEFVEQVGILYRCISKNGHSFKQLVVSASLRDQIMMACHDYPLSGHLGYHQILDRICYCFYWPGMTRHVRFWVNSCQDCATKKQVIKNQGTLHPIPIDEPFKIVNVDIVGPLPKTQNGNTYILVFSDYLTKWTEAFPLSNIDSATVAQLLVEQVICRHGAPIKLLSDRGSSFLSALIYDVYAMLNISKVTTTAYHPQTDGLVEQFNKTLIEMLSMFTSTHQDDWNTWIPYVLFAYCTF